VSKQRAKEPFARAARRPAEAYGPPTRVVLRLILTLFLVMAVLWIISKITVVILLLVLSIFFAYLVSPLVDFIREPRTIGNRKIAIPKVAAISISYVILLGAVVFAIFVIVPSIGNQFPEFATQARSYWQSLGEKAQQLVEYFRTRNMPDALADSVKEAVPQVRDTVLHTVTDFFYVSLGYVIYLPWLILIPILAFFLLKDADSFRRSALLMLPRGRWRWRGDEFFQDINSTLAAYIRAQLTACVFIGVVWAFGF
jgi:predicted PurR-regulated permease PerM